MQSEMLDLCYKSMYLGKTTQFTDPFSGEEFVMIIDKKECFVFLKNNPSICSQAPTLAEALEKCMKYKTVMETKLSEPIFDSIMLDIETLGDTANAVIISIGAVKFNIKTGATGENFHQFIPLQNSLECGMEVSASTLMWWFNQTPKSQRTMVEGLNSANESLIYVLENFAEFCNKDLLIWAKSPRFDCGILGNAYKKIGYEVPWDFRKERDVRTLSALIPDVEKNWVYNGTAHDALSDCYNQIGYCCEVWKKLSQK